MRKTHILIIAIVLYGLVGDLYFRDISRIIGIGLTVLFLIFLYIHSVMDKKGKFLPKKRDKEG